MITLFTNRLFCLALTLIVTGVLYLSTLQTVPNGSSDYYMIDVGETQIVLNRWGTLHATGYPHYVMTGSALVTILRGLGLDAATAPTLVAWIWGMVALALFYLLAEHLTEMPLLAAGVTILFGLTRTVWIHASIAEIYSFGLVILLALLNLALWKTEIPHLTDFPSRIYWMALLGGIGIAHHRAIVMAIPALLYAVCPTFRLHWREMPKIVWVSVALGLLGFLPYIYLPLRAMSGEKWIYGDPTTWQGFLDQFLGREANRFIGLPESLSDLGKNIALINTVLLRDLTPSGLLIGFVGLSLALRRPETRRAAVTFSLSALAAYAFHSAFYTDILSALILPVTLSLAFGWLFLGMEIERFKRKGAKVAKVRKEIVTAEAQRPQRFNFPVLVFLVAWWFIFFLILTIQNQSFIKTLTTDRTGLETIALIADAPDGSTVMLAWGPRYFSAAFAKDVQGRLETITLVDDKVDFSAIRLPIITPDYTLFNQPLAWWQARLDAEQLYLSTAAPHLVAIDTQPQQADASLPNGINMLSAQVRCEADRILLDVMWAASDVPERDLSVFVHLVDSQGNVVAQGDQSAPVYGWRPLTTWTPAEQIRDVYILPTRPDATEIRYGLYYQAADGAFINDYEFTREITCLEN